MRTERLFNPNKRTYLPMRYIAFKDPSNLRCAGDRSSVNINDIIDWKRRSPSANAQRWESWTSSRTSISKKCTAHAVLPLFSAAPGYAPLEELVIHKSNPSWEPQSTGQLFGQDISWRRLICLHRCTSGKIHNNQPAEWFGTRQNRGANTTISRIRIQIARLNYEVNEKSTKMKSSSFKDGVGTRDPRRLLATDTEPHIEKKPATIAWGRVD